MLISMFRLRVDLENELSDLFYSYRLFTTENVELELKSMRGSDAKSALNFLEERCVLIPSKAQTADDDLLHTASERNFFLATNDRELRKRATDMGIRTLYIRNRKRLEISDGAAQI